jgi:ribonuclease P protein component
VTRRHPHAVTAIRDRSTFQALRRPAGRGARGPVKVAYVPPVSTATGAAGPRVGYSVGRSCGNAVQRNRLRRRFRAAVRQSARNLAVGSYLLRAEPAAVELPYGPLVEAVAGAMTDAARSAETRREGLQGAPQ